MGICILMGIKMLPSRQHYWLKDSEFFKCSTIMQVMSGNRWHRILRCLHLARGPRLEIKGRHEGRDVPQRNQQACQRLSLLHELFCLPYASFPSLHLLSLGKYVRLDLPLMRSSPNTKEFFWQVITWPSMYQGGAVGTSALGNK